MGKQRGKIGKYSKISLQKKFELLRLSKFNNLNLKETSKKLKINYSTAKTILFQYQKNKIGNSLSFIGKKLEEQTEIQQKKACLKMAIYKFSENQQKGKTVIKICSSLNRQLKEKKIKKRPELFENKEEILQNSIQHLQQMRQNNKLYSDNHQCVNDGYFQINNFQKIKDQTQINNQMQIQGVASPKISQHSIKRSQIQIEHHSLAIDNAIQQMQFQQLHNHDFKSFSDQGVNMVSYYLILNNQFSNYLCRQDELNFYKSYFAIQPYFSILNDINTF